MFRAFKQGVIGSQNEIKSFRNQWHDQDTQAIFDHARKSMGQNPDLSASAQVQQYGWIEKESREKEAALLRKDGAQEAEEAQVALTQEDISRILDDFHKTYPNLNLTTENGNHNIMVRAACHLLYDPLIVFRYNLSPHPHPQPPGSDSASSSNKKQTASTN